MHVLRSAENVCTKTVSKSCSLILTVLSLTWKVRIVESIDGPWMTSHSVTKQYIWPTAPATFLDATPTVRSNSPTRSVPSLWKDTQSPGEQPPPLIVTSLCTVSSPSFLKRSSSNIFCLPRGSDVLEARKNGSPSSHTACAVISFKTLSSKLFRAFLALVYRFTDLCLRSCVNVDSSMPCLRSIDGKCNA